MRIGCLQHAAPGRIDRTGLRAAAARAADAGARLLVTPELSLTGYHLGRTGIRAAAEPADGPLCAMAAEIAAECSIALVVHKLSQNSITVLRRTSDTRRRRYGARAASPVTTAGTPGSSHP